jgi:hypothetical protein
MDPSKVEQGDHPIDVDKEDWPPARSGMRVWKFDATSGSEL